MQYGLGHGISNGSYSFSNPVFASFASYSSMVLLKMLGMSTYTIIQRFRTGNFSTSEDDLYKRMSNRIGLLGINSGMKPNLVDRARNNHLNDLENILPFVLVGLFYVGTRPKFDYAFWHFRIFLLSRLLHTIAYQVLRIFIHTSIVILISLEVPLPQPTRTIAWLLGYSSVISMSIPILRSIQW